MITRSNKVLRTVSMATKPRILVTHSQVPENALTFLKDKYELVFSPGLPRPSREQMLKDVKGVTAILYWAKEKFDKEFISAAGDQLRIVALMSAGYDHVDVQLLKSLNIKVSNTPDVLNSSVAEIAIGLLLATSRKILEGYKIIISGEWEVLQPLWMCGFGLENSTVGVIGLGKIGCIIAKRLKAFDVSRILYAGRKEKEEGKQLGATFVSLDELLRESDFVIVSCALTDETKHLLDKDKFEKMKPSSVLVNVSRGDVIQQDDLVEALKKGVIGGAGLDVMTPEPLPSDHPLTKLNNCVLCPHLGSATFATREAMARLAAQNIYNALNDIPILTPI